MHNKKKTEINFNLLVCDEGTLCFLWAMNDILRMVCTSVEFRKIETQWCERALSSEGDRGVVVICGEMIQWVNDKMGINK
jgi:hypothetical protein